MSVVARGLRLLRAALTPMRQRGLGWRTALLWQLPVATGLRAWRAMAGPLNARLLTPWLNAGRFARFQDGLPPSAGLRLYVIVMPHTLHFLLPCLALLERGGAPIVLIVNGAKRWECQVLRRRLPAAPMFHLCNLPGAALPHGDAVSLLIEHQRGDFAIVDHDAYVFDPALIARLQPVGDECMVAPFSQLSPRGFLEYPLTHVLGLRADYLRGLMHRHAIDARLYRETPVSARPALQRIGIGERGFFKEYQRFHDTLHVLLAVALDDGHWVRFEHKEDGAEPAVFHLGGTSIGSHHTKNLFALYVHLRFLALLDDPVISARYAFLTRPLCSADEALARRVRGDPSWDALPVVEALMERLRAAGVARAAA